MSLADIIKKILPKRLFVLFQPAYHFLFSWLAAAFFRFPSQKIIVVGVTGTAGKTSTVYLAAKALEAAGYKTGFTSTAVFSDGDKEWLNDKKMTMPGRFFIQKSLRRMVRNNCRYAIVETTSEGIKQFRHRFINYDVLIFTSLYPEHIESHGSFEKYKSAKGALFAHLSRCRHKYVDESKIVHTPKNPLRKLDLMRVPKTIIVNGDDDWAAYFLGFPADSKIIYTFDDNKNEDYWRSHIDTLIAVKDLSVIQASNPETSLQGSSVNLDGAILNLRLIGEYNLYNALAAYSLASSQGAKLDRVAAGLGAVSSLAGKLENIDVGQDFGVIVDYAFEPKALEKLYQTIDLFPRNRLIHLLGSTGGGRDKSRRAVLGRMAARKADIVIVSNEDPYDEDPQLIIDQVAAGAIEAGKIPNKDLFRFLDRRDGIRFAISQAKSGDLVLLTGKGAEQWICIAKGSRLPWDERAVAKEELLKTC